MRWTGRARTVVVSAPGKLPWQAIFTATTDWTYDVWLSDDPQALKPTAAPVAPSLVRKPGQKRPATSRKTTTKTPGALRDLDF